jgi:hypothetical protein
MFWQIKFVNNQFDEGEIFKQVGQLSTCSFKSIGFEKQIKKKQH